MFSSQKSRLVLILTAIVAFVIVAVQMSIPAENKTGSNKKTGSTLVTTSKQFHQNHEPPAERSQERNAPVFPSNQQNSDFWKQYDSKVQSIWRSATSSKEAINNEWKYRIDSLLGDELDYDTQVQLLTLHSSMQTARRQLKSEYQNGTIDEGKLREDVVRSQRFFLQQSAQLLTEEQFFTLFSVSKDKLIDVAAPVLVPTESTLPDDFEESVVAPQS